MQTTVEIEAPRDGGRTRWAAPRRRIACLGALLVLDLATLGAASAFAAVGSPSAGAPPVVVSGSASGSNGGAAASGNAFNELSKGAEAEQSTQTQKTSTTSEQTSNSKKTILVVIGVALVLLIGVAFVIVRDARRVAPAVDGPVADARSARDNAAVLRKRRAKARAAKQQRKRNR